MLTAYNYSQTNTSLWNNSQTMLNLYISTIRISSNLRKYIIHLGNCKFFICRIFYCFHNFSINFVPSNNSNKPRGGSIFTW